MAIIKCKMCGGDLNIIEGASTAECDFCGSQITLFDRRTYGRRVRKV